MAEDSFLHLRCDALLGTLRMQAAFSLDQQWTVLFGPSASGKSSLLRLIAGLWKPHGASIVLNGMEIASLPPHRRHVCLLAQQPALFPHMSVSANVRYRSRTGADGAVRAMDLFSIGGLASVLPHNLSGGETQRVAMARALASQPRLLLLDESFSGLDRPLRNELIANVREQTLVPGLRVLSVTHDVEEALMCGDAALRMSAGRIIAAGLPRDILAEPRQTLIDQLTRFA